MSRWQPRRLALVAALAATACGSSAPSDQAVFDEAVPTVAEAEQGFAAVELSTFDGEPFRLDMLQGRPVLVNFFASWCAPCVREMPEIEAVKSEFGERVAFVGINVTDDEDDADELVADTGVTWQLARDRDGLLLQAVGGRAMPTTLVLDRAGKIVEARSGSVTRDEVRAMLAAVLEGDDG